MTIDWHNQHPLSWSLPQDFSNSAGYLVPANIQISLLTNPNADDLKKSLSVMAAEILEDPIAIAEFTERVYHLMQQDLQNKSDRLGYRRDLLS